VRQPLFHRVLGLWVYQVPVSQGWWGEGLTKHHVDAVHSEDIEDTQVGEFGLDEPEDILKKVRASKGLAKTASMRAPPRVVDGDTSLAHRMARRTEQV
jgi:hypothetical protein